MVKRKADEVPQRVLTTRPRTRSGGLLDTQPALPFSNKKRRNARSTTSAIPVEEPHQPAEVSRNMEVQSEDEINLLEPSSSKAAAGSATPRDFSSPKVRVGTPRQIMDAVVISTPKSVLRTPQKYFMSTPGSPSPSRLARNIVQASPGSSSRDKRTSHPTRQNPQLHSPITGLPSAATSSSPQSASPTRTMPSPLKSTIATQRLPRPLPSHLVLHLHSQKRLVLNALQHPTPAEHCSSTHSSAFEQLTELVNGTTQRHEGNSCLILGPKGSGKSRLVDRVLASVASTSTCPPAVVRLSAHCQTNDRLAMREIARQIGQQIGSYSLFMPDNSVYEEDSVEGVDEEGTEVPLPPSSHLPGMIATLPSLGRPVIVVLDGFDGFAAHARQALLYCLLDTVQSSRGNPSSVAAATQNVDPFIDTLQRESSVAHDDEGTPDNEEVTQAKTGHGLMVIGVTSRVDCLTLLEKRVKSRFSHRIIRVGTLSGLKELFELLGAVLDIEIDDEGSTAKEWKRWWKISVKEFLANREVLNAMKEIFAFGKDLRIPLRLLIAPVVSLTPSSPWLTASELDASVSAQRCPRQFPFLTALPYPHIALLIAASHTQTAGHDIFNFEMVYDTFVAQVRVSVSAPVQVERGGLGMVSVSRGVMSGAFEQLVASHVFRPVTAPSTHVTKEFVKYRCIPGREDIKRAVEHLGQTHLKKWFLRNQ